MKYTGKPIAWAISMTLAALSCTTGCSSDTEKNLSAVAEQTAASDTVPKEPAATSTDSNLSKAVVTTERENESESKAESVTAELSPAAADVQTRAKYTADDLTSTYAQYDAEITLTGETASVQGATDAVSVDGGNVIILQSGVYYITGTLTDGRISVTGEDKVMLYLDGVSVTSTSGGALECTNEKRTIVSLAPDSENSFTEQFSCVGDVTEDIAAIYAKDKLTINGSGSLTVCGTTGNGILCQDDLRIAGGTISVTAASNGLKGTESVSVCDGDITINAGNDGIKSTKSDNAEKGWVAIDGGTFHITAGGDGIQAENTLEIADGTFDVTTTGAVTASSSEDRMGGRFGGGGFGGHGGGRFGGEQMAPPDGFQPDAGAMPPQWNGGNMQPPEPMPEYGENMPFEPSGVPESSTDADPKSDAEDVSSKGLKSGGAMTISGGTIALSTTDHSIHAADNIHINGGMLQIASSVGKGISAHGDLNISGDTTAITIDTCTEGIESKANLTISGGNIRILDASDDGINVSGSGCAMTFNGGTIYVNARGDGFDSNGTVTFNGGTMIISGPVSGGDGSFDGDGVMTYHGGLILGLSANGMMELPESGCMVTTSANAAAGDVIAVLDAQGQVVIAVRTEKAVTDVIFSTDSVDDITACKLVTGCTYEGSLNADGWAVGGSISGGTEVNWAEVSVAGITGGFGGHGGGKPHDFGGFQGFGDNNNNTGEPV